MKQNLIKFLFLIAIIISPSFVQNVLACQCFGVGTPYESFNNSKAVFAGKIISITDQSGKEVVKKKIPDSADNSRREIEEGERNYRFSVQEWFKGGKESEVVVSHYLNMCEFGFDVGDEFLIYASESQGKLRTSTFCARTRNLESAKREDIHFIRELLKGIREPRIYGSVRLNDKNLITNYSNSKFLEGIKVVAKSSKNQYQTVTDKNGLYRFKKLPEGKYEVYLDMQNRHTYNEDYSWDRLTEINLLPIYYKDQPAYHLNQFEYNKFVGTNAYTNFHLRWK